MGSLAIGPEISRQPLLRICGKKPVDALIAAMWPYTTLVPLACKLSCRNCRVLVSEHNPLSVQYRDWGWWHRPALRGSMALGYRLADARVGVSKGVADDMARLSETPRSQIEVINNPVPERHAPRAI